jgi:UDP-N-acetylglucosamine 2-epimerase (non-hydrolysing)
VTASAGRPAVMVVFGTRPEAIKLAPVILALQASQLFDTTVVVTAQHRQMLDEVLECFGIHASVDLDIIQAEQSLTDITVRALSRFSPWVEQMSPDLVLVQGDTTTAFVASLGAFYWRVPVVHLEAGLRTLNPYQPFPEEINRRLTTQLTTLHLAPTPVAKANLLAEGVSEERVIVTGNTAIDALLWASQKRSSLGATLDEFLGASRRLVLVTAHRRESWGAPMAAISEAVAEIASVEPNVGVVVALHRNPAVRRTIIPILAGLENVLVIDPLPYPAFVQLMGRADLILTDSGGIQEEAPSLGKPVLVMRDVTERPEGIATGVARLVGTDRASVVHAVRAALDRPVDLPAPNPADNPYGDGLASQRVVAAMVNLLGAGERPPDFHPAHPTGGRVGPS